MQVWPKNDSMRKLLKHPHGKVGFHETGSAEWPDDSFTYRRIQDGDVVLKDPTPAMPMQSAEKKDVGKA